MASRSGPAMAVGFILFLLFAGFMAVVEECDSPDASVSGSEDSWSITFPEDFSPALAGRDDLGISVVLAVDVSGSMGGNPASGGQVKYLQATKALEQVMTVLGRLVASSPPNQPIRLGLLRFHSVVEPVLELTTLTPGNLARVRKIAANPDTWSPEGATAIGDALALGTTWLAQSGTILRSLIVITDGENTEGVEPSWVLSAIYNNRNSASSDQFPVFTSSNLVSVIGFDIDSNVFNPFRQYGARVSSASDQEQLARVLSNLLEADITRLEAPAF